MTDNEQVAAAFHVLITRLAADALAVRAGHHSPARALDLAGQLEGTARELRLRAGQVLEGDRANQVLAAFRSVTGWSDALAMHFADAGGRCGCMFVCGHTEDTCPHTLEIWGISGA